jgi:hypothetical protein
MPPATTPLDLTRRIRQLLLRVMRRLAQQEGGGGYALDDLAVDFVKEAGFRLDPTVLGCQDLAALLRANFTQLATLRGGADASSCELYPGPQILQEQQEEQQQQQAQQQQVQVQQQQVQQQVQQQQVQQQVQQQQQQQQQQQFHRHADLSPAEPTRDLGGAAGFAAALAGNMQLLGAHQQLLMLPQQTSGLPASLTLAQSNALGFGAQPHSSGGLLGSAQPGAAGLGLVNGLLNGGQQLAAQPQGLVLPQHLFLGADGQLSQQALAGLAASSLFLQQQQQQQQQQQPQAPPQLQVQQQLQQPGSASARSGMFMPSPFMPSTSQASSLQQPQQPPQQQQEQDLQHVAQPPQVALAPDLLQQLMGYSQLQHLLQQAQLSGTAQQATTSDGLQLPASSLAPAAVSQLLMQHVKQQQAVDGFDATRGGLAQAVAGMESLGQQYQLQQPAPAPQFVEGFSALQTFPTHTVTDAAAVASYYVPMQQGGSLQYAVGTAAPAPGGALAEAPQPSGPVKYHNHYRTYLGE